ncbi:hypothetical protein K1Y79_02985 [Chitinophaga sp. B61]|uniref:Uncharacterized protein n=2 Tax=Chitinophaga rhizophila TaxID=2866212 RepID=A0ABS7G6L0_9BACT|nr:hypothetical protein [Chitinophaga rhizophila]
MNDIHEVPPSPAADSERLPDDMLHDGSVPTPEKDKQQVIQELLPPGNVDQPVPPPAVEGQ